MAKSDSDVASKLLRDAMSAIAAYPMRDDIHQAAQKKWSSAMRKYLDKDYAGAKAIVLEVFKNLEGKT